MCVLLAAHFWVSFVQFCEWAWCACVCAWANGSVKRMFARLTLPPARAPSSSPCCHAQALSLWHKVGWQHNSRVFRLHALKESKKKKKTFQNSFWETSCKGREGGRERECGVKECNREGERWGAEGVADKNKLSSMSWFDFACWRIPLLDNSWGDSARSSTTGECGGSNTGIKWYPLGSGRHFFLNSHVGLTLFPSSFRR